MALPNIFKKKKEEKEKKVKKDAKIDVRKEKKREQKKKKKRTPVIAPQVLLSPRITEKTTNLASEGKYVFEVFKEANKIEVKKAVEELYGVKVEKVNIINIPRKRRRIGRNLGWKKGYKKAIVKLKKGQKIDIMPT